MWKFGIRPKTGFLAHNFGYRYANKSIKGSIDADFDLVFNKTESKEWVNRLGPRAGQRRPKFQKHLHFGRSHQRTPHRKWKTFFSISTRRLAESVEGLNSSLALAAGELWPKNASVGRKELIFLQFKKHSINWRALS